jgi:hypothetical protein
MPIEVGMLRQGDCEFKASISDIPRPCLKNKNNKTPLNPTLGGFFEG